jgi:hypothetical protein
VLVQDMQKRKWSAFSDEKNFHVGRSVGPVYQLLPVLAVHKQHTVVAPSHPLSNWEKTRFGYLSGAAD